MTARILRAALLLLSGVAAGYAALIITVAILAAI